MAQRPARFYSTDRVENYTDAVFAIAATLLVLDLTSNAIGNVSSDTDMWQALRDMYESFVAFGVSFALLSLLWTIHLRQWRDISRVDSALLWLNNARLLFVVLIPFTTSLVSGYSEFYAGRMLLPINFFFAALTGYLSWVWAARSGAHLLSDTSEQEIRAENLGGLAAVICGALAAAISPWVGSWAFFAYAFNGVLASALTRRADRRAARRGDATDASTPPG